VTDRRSTPRMVPGGPDPEGVLGHSELQLKPGDFFSPWAKSLLSIVGLFVPMPIYRGGPWHTSVRVGHVPLGWIMVAIALVVKWL
jgi:hypothetical protein